MNFAILGAGGIGGYYGARLLQAGHTVIHVARGEHLQALNRRGLELRHPEFRFQGPVQALSLETLMAGHRPAEFAALLLCAKATATRDIAPQLAGWFRAAGQGAPVISLQNGVDNEPELAEHINEEEIIGGLAVCIGGHVLRPGVVEATGQARIIFGPWPRQDSPAGRRHGEHLAALAQVFNAAGIPAERVADIRRELWRKLLINNGVNPLSALTRLDTRTLTRHPRFGPMVLALIGEAAAAARADGVDLGPADVSQMHALIRDFDAIKTSMLVDREKGRPLELEAISGAVLARAAQLGIPAPYTQTVYSLLRHAIETASGS